MAAASSRVLEAAWFNDGSLLEKCAKENLRGFAKLYPQQLGEGPVAKLPRTQLLWGSACSGCEGASFVADAINASFAEAQWPVRLRHSFSCESSRDKQKWVHVVAASSCLRQTEDAIAADVFGNDASDLDDDESDHRCIFADIQTLVLRRRDSPMCCA